VLGVSELHQLERPVHALFTAFFFSVAPNTRSAASWTFSKHVSHGQQRMVLEHHAAVWAWPRDFPVGEKDMAVARLEQPVTMLSSVDLPQPECPISETNSPA